MRKFVVCIVALIMLLQTSAPAMTVGTDTLQMCCANEQGATAQKDALEALLFRKWLSQSSATLFAGGPGLTYSYSGHTMPTTGDVRPLVLVIDFPDKKMTDEQYTTLSKGLYAENDMNQRNFEQSARAILQRFSYGKLNIGGEPREDILPTYTAPENSDNYNSETYEGQRRFNALVTDVLASNFDDNPERNYSDYDADGDGCIDALIIWSANTVGAHAINDVTLKISDPKIRYANRVDVGPYLKLGAGDTIAHELCHSMGIEDAYISDLCKLPNELNELMSGYSAHLNVYSRYILDWLEPTVLTASDPVQSIDLYSADWYGGEIDDTKPRTIVLIPENRDLPLTEFYMLEYRPHTTASTDDPPQNFESVFPAQPGIVIWHCNTEWDDYFFLHRDSYRLPVYRSGDESSFTIDDFFTTGTVFSPETTPSSDFYDDVKTGIYVEVVQADGGEYATLNVGFLDILPPEVGDEGAITASDVTTDGVVLSWTAAEDKQTKADDLTYTLYRSDSDELDTVEQCEAATEVASGSAMTTNAVTGLEEDATYYFNVVVADEAGNKSVYAKRKVALREHAAHDFSGKWQSNSASHWHECLICYADADKAEHSPVIDPAVPATCTVDGKTEGSHCEVCGHVITAQTVIPATGHSYSTTLTGDETGHGYKCANCGDFKDAAEHTLVIDTLAAPATCATDGRTEGSHCEVCGYIKASTVIPATGHSYSANWIINKTMHWNNCEKCGETDWGSIALHSPVTDWEEVATCTEDGVTEGSHCEVCGYVITAPTVIPATGHSYSTDLTGNETGHGYKCANCDDMADWAAHIEDEGTVTKEPTEEDMGVKTFTCSVCGYVMRTESIPATGGSALGGLAWSIDATGKLTLAGEFPDDGVIWVACWNGKGRFLSAQVLTAQRMTVQLEPSWARLKLLWLNESFAPKCSAVEIAK